MIRTALLVDVHNLYTSSLKKHPGKIVNYEALLQFVNDTGNYPVRKYAYGKQTLAKAGRFGALLQRLGFELTFGPEPHVVQMTLQGVNAVSWKYDHLILGTNNPEFSWLAQYALDRGTMVSVLGFDVPVDAYPRDVSVVEISPELLQARPPAVSMDVSADVSGNPAVLPA